MSDPSFLTYEFSRSLPRPQLLTEIGQGIRGVQQQAQARDLEAQYNVALDTALQNPTNENISQLYQVAEPLGRFNSARMAVEDQFARMPQPGTGEVPGEDPNMALYEQAFSEWESDPLDPGKRNALLRISQSPGVDLFDSTQDIVAATMEEVQQEQQEQVVRQAEHAYFTNPTRENREAWLQSAREAGVFEEVSEQVEGMSEEERLADVKEGLDIFGPLAHGASDVALNRIDELIEAYRGSDSEEAATAVQSYAELKDLIEDGRIEEAMGIVGTTLAAFEEGQAGMDSALAMAANRREERSFISNMVNRAVETELADENMRSRLKDVVDDWPIDDYGLATSLIDMAQVFEDEGMSEEQRMNAVMSLRNQYLDETSRYQEVYEQGGQVRQAALRAIAADAVGMDDDAIGAADLALVNAFQRQIDPATVRESDIQNLRSTIGGLAQVEQWVEQFRSGSKFSPEQRRTIMSVSNQLSGVYDKVETRARDFVEFGAERIKEDPTDIIGEKIFNPLDSEQRLEEYKSVISEIYPSQAGVARNASSLEELEKEFPRAYEAMTGAMAEVENKTPDPPDPEGTEDGPDWDAYDWGDED